jgi:hypothetical protein
MHARVTTLSGSPANVDAGIANFRDNVVPYAKSEGRGAILLVDRCSGTAAERMGAAQPTVDRYEVAVLEM